MKHTIFLAMVLSLTACGTPTSTTSSTAEEAPYQVIFPITDVESNPSLSPEELSNISEKIRLIEAELAHSKLKMRTRLLQKLQTFTVADSTGNIVKQLNIANLMGNDCCGFICAQNAKDPIFVALDPVESPKKIKTYFGIQ